MSAWKSLYGPFGLRVQPGRLPEHLRVLAQQLGLALRGIAAHLPAVVRRLDLDLVVLQQAGADGRVARRAPVVDDLLALPQRVHAGLVRRAGEDDARKLIFTH